MKSVLEYTDFRAWLKDWLAARKSAGLPASNRWFAQELGVNSSGWLTLVLSGKKGLSRKAAERVSQFAGHTPVEQQYFFLLIKFNQARTLGKRNLYYAQLQELQRQKGVRIVSDDQYEFYSEWYHSAVRSLIGCLSLRVEDAEAVADLIKPKITPGQVRKSIKLLKRLGFVIERPDGTLVLSDAGVSTGSLVRSTAVANFQQETMRLAMEAMDRFSPDQRDISTVTVGVSSETFTKIKRLLAQTRRQVAEMADNDRDADRVCQLNMQFFPLSDFPKRAQEERG